MNVVATNKNKDIFDKLDIEIIKRVDGEYELKELLMQYANMYFNKMIIDITAIKGYRDINELSRLARAVDPSRVILLLTDELYNDSIYMRGLVDNGFFNFTRNVEGIKYLYNNPSRYDDVKSFKEDAAGGQESIEVLDFNNNQSNVYVENGNTIKTRKVIGLVGLTDHSGTTTLTNLLVKLLNNNGISAVGLEMLRQDLIYYHDSNLSSCLAKNDLELKLKVYSDIEVVIIDANDFNEIDKYCDEMIYVIEPSYIRLTKLMRRNRNVFAEHKNDKVILNMSFLNDQSLADFEYETKLKILANIPPVNDRDFDNEELKELLNKLGYKVK